MIGGDDGLHRLLKVTVLSIQGTNVKLGFEVDMGIPVRGSKVWDSVRSNTGQIA